MLLREFMKIRCVLGTCSQCRLYRSVNPGVGRRLKILKQENPDLSKMKIQERDIEDLEMDVMNTKLLMKDYKREHDKIKKKIEFQRIERKYFEKKRLPNFLLWSEKEQIRQLHDSQPDKWTVEVLSQSFPAVPDVIRKIVKARWKIKDVEALKKHDNQVLNNWKLFKDQKLDLPPHIANHISKFTARDILHMKDSTDLVLAEQKPKILKSSTKSTEFGDIIRNYARREDDSADDTVVRGDDVFMPSKPGETYVFGSRTKYETRRHLTLSAMKDSGKIEPTSSPRQQENSMPFGQDRKSDHEKGVINPSNVFSIPQKAYADSSRVEQTDDPPEEIPMRITIPKNKWKKGAVYKVNNCFYADDGEFLYKI